MAFYLGNMLRLPAFLKIGEIIFQMIIIGIAQGGNVGFGFSKHSAALGYGIVIGYLIVNLILVLCYSIGETGTQRSKFELLLNVVGSILYISLAIYLFVKSNKYWDNTKVIVEAVFMLMIAVCQILDAVFIFKRSNE